MKKNLFIIITLILISAGFFSACKEKEEECKNLHRENIIGKWKLIEVSVSVNYSQSDTTDYSQENIIFDFQENNKLVVTGNIPDVLVVFDDFQEGEHFYEFFPFECGACPPPTNLNINNPALGSEKGRYFCGISLEETMSIVGHEVVGGVIDDNGLLTGGDNYAWSFTFKKIN